MFTSGRTGVEDVEERNEALLLYLISELNAMCLIYWMESISMGIVDTHSIEAHACTPINVQGTQICQFFENLFETEVIITEKW